MRPEAEIVVAGMACRFPDADDPAALFENSLAGRQSFRPIPPSRLPLDLYAADRIGEDDSITAVPAGLLADWRFDTARFRVPRGAFASADLSHWLALQVAVEAVEAAGGIDRLDGARTAVVVANTLTGEFSRAALLRLRWPWLDELLAEALDSAELEGAAARRVRANFRDRVRGAFPAPTEESLAGGLANTIAGRIANQLDLRGGAWSVDAACASSLVALAAAADLIAAGRADAAIVAAVDLSLDPFELVGFSRNGALAPRRMRVFDARAEGFWPGEGAGAVILMSGAAARRSGCDADLRLAGWAVSSDGSGGLTRPDAQGQRRALDAAYRQAGIDPATLGYVEAHGTGTAVGDPVEVGALAGFLGPAAEGPLPIGSIKANIGHTKAAAGLAGLIRTAAAIRAGIVPPHVGCEEPHPVFAETGHRLRVPVAPEPWRAGPRAAGISGFGFGGVNAHAVLSAPARAPAPPLPPAPPARNGDLFLFGGRDAAALAPQLRAFADRAASLSFAELGDASAALARAVAPGPLRLAFSADDPGQAGHRAQAALAALAGGTPAAGIRIGTAAAPPRIGFVFPGQAAPARTRPGAWGHRFPGLYPRLPDESDPTRTDRAQPLIARACLAGLDLLAAMGVAADAAVGHSLGELVALAWSGAIPAASLAELAAARGRAMGAVPPGAMLQMSCDAAAAEALAAGEEAGVACFNGARETVLSGTFAAIAEVERRALTAGMACQRLAVSHAFHAASMAAAAPALAEALAGLTLSVPARPVASTVTGGWLPPSADLVALLVRQLTSPVRFAEAVAALAGQTDILVEVGPGAGLRRLLLPFGRPVVGLDVFGESLGPTLDAAAALFVAGQDLDLSPLLGPAVRPFSPAPPALLESPCGRRAAPLPPLPGEAPAPAAADKADPAPAGEALPLLVALLAEETGLPAAVISPEHRFLDHLHLNSISVTRLLGRLGAALGRQPPGYRTAFANASLLEVAAAFAEAEGIPAEAGPARIEGVAPWLRRFRLASAPLDPRGEDDIAWRWTGLDEEDAGAGDGLAVRIGAWAAERDAWPLVRLCQQAAGRYAHLALVHDGAPLGGFARSLAAERLFESVRLIGGGGDAGPALRRRIRGFEEIVPTGDGAGATRALRLCEAAAPDRGPVGTILVTGGARGIAAECALDLALRVRAPLILVGRSAPDAAALAPALDRAAAAGVRLRYVQADVGDEAALTAGVGAAAAQLGPVTHLIHAAGINEPAPLPALTEALVAETLAPKCRGLAAAAAACGPSLRRLVAFSSIIGELGLAGEAHYALANAEQTRLLAALAAERPGLSALSIQWSVWAGVGMGERLGAAERLAAAGIDALRLDEAVAESTALCLSDAEGAVIVASRFACDARFAPDPPRRFLDRSLVYTPGVELVAETGIGPGRDPYLADHRIDGAAIVPGVMLVEAMAQAAAALDPAVVDGLVDLRFVSALHVPDESVAVRIAVLAEPGGAVRAELRSAADGFRLPHAAATFAAAAATRPPAPPAPAFAGDAAPLYGPLFFHGPAFRRIAALGPVSSRRIDAALLPGPETGWFGGFEPQGLVLGDPGARDAALHALQCCIPHRRLVPVAARRLDRFAGGAPVRLRADELWCGNGEYAFDILLVDADDRVVEQWSEALFRDVGAIDVAPVLAAAPALAAAYLERRAREETGDDTLALVLVEDAAAGREDRRARAAAALGLAADPGRRSNGAPIHPEPGRGLSFAHCGTLTIGVSAAGPIGCDIERSAACADGSGPAAWVAEEVLRKLGNAGPLRADGGGRFAGDRAERVVVLAEIPDGAAGPVVVAVGRAPPQ